MLARHGLAVERLDRNFRLVEDQSQIGRAGALATRVASATIAPALFPDLMAFQYCGGAPVRIACIAADAATNSLVRVYPIAKVLQRRHDVVVAGFRSREDIFEPYRDEFDYMTLRAQDFPGFARQVHTLARHVDADLIYAFKPVSASLWPGLAAARRLDVPLVVDIEDWELGWYLDREPIDQFKHLLHLERPRGYLYTAVNDRLVGWRTSGW